MSYQKIEGKEFLIPDTTFDRKFFSILKIKNAKTRLKQKTVPIMTKGLF